MKKYCFDTSGFSNPLQLLPEDLYPSVWAAIMPLISSGVVALTTEIYDEMAAGIAGPVGDCIRSNKQSLVMEIGDPRWDFLAYISHSNRMQSDYARYISERNSNRKDTIGMNDLSTIVLAKTLDLPVVSMEVRRNASPTKRGIPDICDCESVRHLTFNDLLRAERIVI